MDKLCAILFQVKDTLLAHEGRQSILSNQKLVQISNFKTKYHGSFNIEHLN